MNYQPETNTFKVSDEGGSQMVAFNNTTEAVAQPPRSLIEADNDQINDPKLKIAQPEDNQLGMQAPYYVSEWTILLSFGRVS
jgi:hypothetical protein